MCKCVPLIGCFLKTPEVLKRPHLINVYFLGYIFVLKVIVVAGGGGEERCTGPLSSYAGCHAGSSGDCAAAYGERSKYQHRE